MAEIQFISKSKMLPYGTTQLRCVQPASYLENAGWTCKLGCVYRNMPQATRAIVFHRAIGDAQTWSYVSYAKAKGLVLIYDVDDFLFEEIAEPSAPQYREIMKEFDVVFASTRFLADKIKDFHSDVRVVQSGLSDSFVKNLESTGSKRAEINQEINQESPTITIGYFSGSAHHDQDFKLVEDSLLKVLREFANVRLLLVGKLKYSEEFKVFSDQFEYREFMPYADFQRVFKDVDVNLATNRIDHPKAQGRSEIKYVEAAAWKVPTVASPTETYKTVINHRGNGLLAADGEWMRQLVDVIKDHDLRLRLGAEAFEDVSRNYFPAAKCNEWKELINDVMDSYGEAARSRRRSLVAPMLYLKSCAHWTKRFLKRTKRDFMKSDRNLQQNGT